MCSVGLIKRKSLCMFKCSTCDKRFPSQGELNSHYRANYDQVKHTYCKKYFHTPSSLVRHLYSHEIATKKCCYGKIFRFDSELRAHKLKHKWIPTQHCTHRGCKHSYFSASNLAKHAKTHENVVWRCVLCNYQSNDQRLLKSHQHKHEHKTSYTCTKCGKIFIYHMQWSRHCKSNNCA